jgi:hypothetical protein
MDKKGVNIFHARYARFRAIAAAAEIEEAHEPLALLAGAI